VINPNFLSFSTKNPRKGTETIKPCEVINPNFLSFSTKNPRKGTETIKPCEVINPNFLSFSTKNPRKGTETSHGKKYSVQELPVSQSKIPARGLKLPLAR
jgi:hypothetical protein